MKNKKKLNMNIKKNHYDQIAFEIIIVFEVENFYSSFIDYWPISHLNYTDR